jgi:hypothetical protein
MFSQERMWDAVYGIGYQVIGFRYRISIVGIGVGSGVRMWDVGRCMGWVQFVLYLVGGWETKLQFGIPDEGDCKRGDRCKSRVVYHPVLYG